jgi:hypothetical protein
MDACTLEQLIRKFDVIITYLQNNGDYDYKLYSYVCPYYPCTCGQPDSNLVELAEDIQTSVTALIDMLNANTSNFTSEPF